MNVTEFGNDQRDKTTRKTGTQATDVPAPKWLMGSVLTLTLVVFDLANLLQSSAGGYDDG